MSYYDTLEIKSTATPQEVAQAYRRLSLKWHPRISVHGQYRAYRQFC
jgi:DnaJ-class molecular chaperone